MTPPVNILTWTASALPIVLLLFLLIARRWPAVRASGAALAAALLVACYPYAAGFRVIGVEAAKGVWNSVSIIAVVVPAVMIYELSCEIGGFAAIQRELTRLLPHRLIQVMALGWCFSSFLQGPSGFGVPIAVTAPLLIGIGVRPFWAVVIPLMAHAWGNTFGTLGLGWEALVQQSSLASDPVAYQQAALWSAGLTGMLCLLAGFLICWFYRGGDGLRQGWPALAILGAIMAGGQFALAGVAPTLCTVIPTALALGVAFCLGRLPRYAVPDSGPPSVLFSDRPLTCGSGEGLSLHEALLPYYILLAVSVAVLLTPSLAGVLGSCKMSFSFPETATGHGFINKAHAEYGPVCWLTHAGFFLFLACILSGLYFSRKGLIGPGGLSRIVRNTLHKSLPVLISVVLLLIMSKIMTGSGQVEVLARGTAAVTGQGYAFLAALTGTLGSFMSSSNVSSNILFGQFQESMAQLTHKSNVLFLAAQTSGGAVGTMLSPSKVLLATTTAGIVGQEGIVIKRLMGVALLAAALMGCITFAFA